MSFDAIQYTKLREREPVLRTPKPKKPRHRGRWIVMALVILLSISGWTVADKIQTWGEKIFGSQSFSFGRLFLSADKQLVGEEQGEIHILLLGIAGGDYDGANLSDTMILATIKLVKTDEEQTAVSLFSIPRDFAVNIPGYDIKKINSAYAYGQSGDNDQGPQLAVQTVENFLGTTIPYYAVVDFEGFKNAVDHVGGLEVNVETGFTDAQFPDDRSGYLPPLTFSAGLQTMDGTRALQYVRSRHGNNNQGSDFARAERQQQVLKSFKDKVLRLRTLSNLSLINNLLSDFADHFRTNLQPAELRRLYTLTRDIGEGNIFSQTLDGTTGLVCDYIAPEDGQYLLVPCPGFTDYTAIRTFWKNQFLSGRLASENPVIEIQNAARGQALAQYTATLLSSSGRIIQTGNYSGDAVYVESIIYDNTGGKKPHTLSYIQKTLGIKAASGPFPFRNITPGGADFVIIVMPDIVK